MRTEVIVTNNNPREWKDSYNGIEYIFKAGEKTPMPVAAAVHIFGFNQEDHSVRNRRCGFTDPLKAKNFFENFNIEFAEYIRKDEADEIEDLKLAVEEKDNEIKALRGEIEKLKEENAQLAKAKE